jgi:hypothetical protein
MTVPPTGKRLDIWGMSMYRIEEGMAREIWERLRNRLRGQNAGT